MESESHWLKRAFRETDYCSSSPQPKRIKFSEVSAELHEQFPGRKFSNYQVSQLIRDTFPHTESKACGRSRQKHITGLERIPPVVGSASGSTSSSLVDNASLASASLRTVAPLRDSASLDSSAATDHTTTSELDTSYSDLLIEIQQLKPRILELEKTSPTSLCQQADDVIHHKSVVTQGPCSLDAFRELDLSSILAELQTRAPDLYQLYMTLGDTKRNTEKDEVTTEDIKAVSSMCSLLNARSARENGLQLLMSVMLVARATSRQVR